MTTGSWWEHGTDQHADLVRADAEHWTSCPLPPDAGCEPCRRHHRRAHFGELPFPVCPDCSVPMDIHLKGCADA